ncbi:MAG TPA: YdeI/OmpD-associated family protein [Bryobacteraceae bacterium]|nr:YdeI/OmpD-associated family protein [Bryobacteraceae bacterium]
MIILDSIRVDPIFFATPAKFRAWLAKQHNKATEQWVGFHKKHTAKPSITWPEAVDVALCYGWIDGVRYKIDEVSYKIRFTPRKPGSNWSSINVKRVEELTKLGLMAPAGLKAFSNIREGKSGIYAYEQRSEAKLDDGFERQFRANSAAWEFFQAQPPWYRRTATYWVISAKRPETREKRLAELILDSAQSLPIKGLRRKPEHK